MKKEKEKNWENLTGKGTQTIIQRKKGEINHTKNILKAAENTIL